MELFITTVVRTSDPTITDYKKQWKQMFQKWPCHSSGG
jgi:hypothetical protein